MGCVVEWVGGWVWTVHPGSCFRSYAQIIPGVVRQVGVLPGNDVLVCGRVWVCVGLSDCLCLWVGGWVCVFG